MKKYYSIGMEILLFILLLQLTTTAEDNNKTPTATLIANKPTITSIAPNHGCAGMTVTINGENFDPSLDKNSVTFNQEDATIIDSTAKKMTVEVPNVSGPVKIIVKNLTTNLSSSPYKQFTIITGITGTLSTQPTGTLNPMGYQPGVGDRRTLRVNTPGFAMKDTDSIDQYYAPVDSIFRIDTPEKNGQVAVHFTTAEARDPNYECQFKIKPKPVMENIEYTVNAATLSTYPSTGWGADYGLLVVPYKFHFTDHAQTGAATVGGYLGWKIDKPGIGISGVVSAGVGVVPVTTQQNGVSTTNNAASFTAAAGLIFTLTKAGMFQAGVLIGADWAGKESQYKYEGKPWIAISFGTNLTK
jgi:hypothetical protein